MANNHSGDVDHGLNIIRTYADICDKYRSTYDFIFKFQYRNLDTFIRKDMVSDMSIPLVKRFSDTRLSEEDFITLLKCARSHDFLTMVTPFDEVSVDLAVNHSVDYLKVASCSFGDWPLLESIAKAGKPVVASCAGSSLDNIDNVTSFFLNRNIYLILQHCVGNYPTASEDINVGQIKFLINRYPLIPIGFSSHEEPHVNDIAPLALALGSQSFEKHVALETPSISKNKYSTSPDEFLTWLQSLDRSRILLGSFNDRYVSKTSELDSLRSLQRGAFLKKDIVSGQTIAHDDLYYAFPPSPRHLTANDISKYSSIVSNCNLTADSPLLLDHVSITNNRPLVHEIAQQVLNIVSEARLVFPDYADLEISHHYGLRTFYKYGLTMITVVNKQYCKKILILLPGQSHPEQFHKIKEETFHVLWGKGRLTLDDVKSDLLPGSVHHVSPGVRHSFSTESGLVLEEISSSHIQSDSYYTDPDIMKNKDRKTFLTHWKMS